MKERINAATRARFVRNTFYVLLLLAAFMLSLALGEQSANNSATDPAKTSFAGRISSRTLTFADRVSYQRVIEEVYWRHRIWPKESPDPKPSLDAVMSREQLEKKVSDDLRNSQALEDYWQRPITSEQLQAEMDRMAQHTKQSEILAELFAALGNDPFVIAECLARPTLAERLLTEWYACDERIHGELRQRAEAELQAHPLVEQMKQLNGKYSEIELVRTDSTNHEHDVSALHQRELNSAEWNGTMTRLAATFNKSNAANAYVPRVLRSRVVDTSESSLPNDSAQLRDADTAVHLKSVSAMTSDNLPVGKVSALQEDEECYYATAVISKTDQSVKLATLTWPKEQLESWIGKAENQVTGIKETVSGSYTLPTITSNPTGCADNTWTPSSMNLPIGTWGHAPVWTGSEMIVWGGENLIATFATGARYNPSTDTWTAMSLINSPSPRVGHTAVWTGSEMIVWGGGAGSNTNSGGRYNPLTDRWLHVATANAPSPRSGHTAVWTGSQMIVWGGANNSHPLTTGGRYNPSTNTWIATSTINTPSARFDHTAVWTGTEMIVWGGWVVPYTHSLNTGGRYNPVTNIWSATSTANAPIGRHRHTAVWTGTQMIVWGGVHDETYADDYLNSGGRYKPATNNWSATSTTNAPTARNDHMAVWTGSDMLVWGGGSNAPGVSKSGAKYHPATNSWTAISTTNAPDASGDVAVWTGSEMIVWGGGGDHSYSSAVTTGGRYNPSTNTWVTMNRNAPSDRQSQTAVWTGTEMIIWGGEDDNHSDLAGVTNTGGRYRPSTDSWTRTSMTNAPSTRSGHTAVWTGTEMIVWGGGDYFGTVDTGGRYNPGTNSWRSTSTTNAPTHRGSHTAVWTGSQMIIWGGYGDTGVFNSGGKYNPVTNAWAPTSTTNAPLSRWYHTAVWLGTQMIVWGGTNVTENVYFNTGGRYNPSTNSWAATSTTNAPSPRRLHTAVSTGNEMIIWGGYFQDSTGHVLNTGGRYNPHLNSWTATSINNAPTARNTHSAVWTGREMIVWGGDLGYLVYGTGGRYDPAVDSWTAVTTTNAPTARYQLTAIWTGAEMIVWGGFGNVFGPLGSGGIYCAQ
jgi:N-acetylneuraminic acid mutarotase